MKKILFLMLSILLLSIFGCDSDKAGDTKISSQLTQVKVTRGSNTPWYMTFVYTDSGYLEKVQNSIEDKGDKYLFEHNFTFSNAFITDCFTRYGEIEYASTEEWRDLDRIAAEYTGENLTRIEEFTNDDDNKERWTKTSQTDYSYTDTDYLSTTINYDVITNDLSMPTSKYSNEFGEDALTYITYQEIYNTGDWTDETVQSKCILVKNSDGKIIEKIIQTDINPDPAITEWTNSSRVQYKYDDEGRLIVYKNSSWDTVADPDEWDNTNKTEFDFDDRGNIKTVQYFTPSGSSWSLNRKYSYNVSYNGDGLPSEIEVLNSDGDELRTYALTWEEGTFKAVFEKMGKSLPYIWSWELKLSNIGDRSLEFNNRDIVGFIDKIYINSDIK